MFFSKALVFAVLSLGVAANEAAVAAEDCARQPVNTERDKCYLRQHDCNNISHSSPSLYDQCQAYWKNRKTDWKATLDECTANEKVDEDKRECYSSVCEKLTVNDRDACWDKISALCYRRSTVEKRDSCYSSRGECSEIKDSRKLADCNKKHPKATSAPAPPRATSAPASCSGDNDCFNKGVCDRIQDNVRHDECYYKKKNRTCDPMRELKARDFCYACTKQCNRISNDPTSNDMYEGCNRGTLSASCNN
ncbi:hypothetical protein BT63DRAFT_481817 [Microthyrium microscopicum]|uniref:ShKT domain-containing protein n=1 Tax=Microthyrium microscopicum TaxID=703497 RepID=A0A6A6U3J4_9PEZI|nr:hypothetical protein BT63DRAFT_481817 [Microthyrium microscopicum]